MFASPQIKPNVFVINLAQSTDRLALCQQRLAPFDIALERIDAVYGKNLSDSELSEHFSHYKNAVQYHRPLTLGEIGCYLSHRKAWQKIVDEQLPYAIVIEDDIELIGNLDKAIASIEKIKEHWDYLKLASYQQRYRKVIFEQPIDEHFSLTLYKKVMSGAAAQAVSLSGAKKLLVASAQFGRPVDTDIQHWWERDLKLFNLHPYVFAQDMSFDSDIAQTGSRKTLSTSQKVKKQILSLRKNVNNKQYTSQRLKTLK